MLGRANSNLINNLDIDLLLRAGSDKDYYYCSIYSVLGMIRNEEEIIPSRQIKGYILTACNQTRAMHRLFPFAL